MIIFELMPDEQEYIGKKLDDTLRAAAQMLAERDSDTRMECIADLVQRLVTKDAPAHGYIQEIRDRCIK